MYGAMMGVVDVWAMMGVVDVWGYDGSSVSGRE